MKTLLFLATLLLMVSCSETEPTVAGRWYTQAQVDSGHTVFQNNCAVCHGKKAQGTLQWRKPLADGSYPPPPLNGNAHTWHHPMASLRKTIQTGGVPVGGKMPPFENTLSDEEIDAVIAYFQSKWSPKIYDAWAKRVNK